MADKDIINQITKRRKQCLIHRYLYYVIAEPIISDYQYDMMERDLRSLVEAYPDLARKAPFNADCPTRHVGSSNLDDYPREIQQLADDMLATSKKGAA